MFEFFLHVHGKATHESKGTFAKHTKSHTAIQTLEMRPVKYIFAGTSYKSYWCGILIYVYAIKHL